MTPEEERKFEFVTGCFLTIMAYICVISGVVGVCYWVFK